MYVPPPKNEEAVSKLDFPDGDATSLDISSDSVTTSSSVPTSCRFKTGYGLRKCASESDLSDKAQKKNTVVLSLDDIEIYSASAVVSNEVAVDSDDATEVTEEYQSENELESKPPTEEGSRKIEKVNTI